MQRSKPQRGSNELRLPRAPGLVFHALMQYPDPNMTSSGTVINGRYQLQGEPLGQGGMGIVHKAYDEVTKRHVALKTMRGTLDAVALELFTKEWTVLSRINHPNIVDIFDTGEFQEDGERKPFFVMPLLPGRTLDYLIKNQSQRLTVERVTEIVLQTCRGLQAAHEHGLVHRDLKPSNIFVMEDDTVKIIDFGVVHLAGSDSVVGIKGTLQYMAPEQIDMKPTTSASDIFSLGIVCYEALTGRKPFARKSDAETADALRHHIPPPVCELNPVVSQLISRVIHKAMAKAPYHRYSSARDYSETLQKALNNQPIERFDKAKTQPRIERVKKAQGEGDFQFASEVLLELEAEGHIDPEMAVLRIQIDHAIRQKSIRHLLDGARTRREEDEFPLALQKIQEVLEIDPDNADALSLRIDIEKQRSEGQIENWFRLVDQHVHHHSFEQAKQALVEIRKLDPNNARGRQLGIEVDRMELEINRLRSEKEQLYQSALSSFQNGEISSALSKLERVLEVNRKSPDSATPDRDAQYQGLYNQIRTEREAARNSYAEGRRLLADRKFSKALEVCAEFLRKFPGDPLFQSLKLETEENERQEHSSFVAEVTRKAEAEPNLDRRVNILKEAAERYPDEPHFQQSLRLIRERRDLVNAIVAKARQYEERSQFSEALGQWDILRNIYLQYPGLEFELERLMRRRDEQTRQEVKGKWVEQIDQSLAAGDSARARDLALAALAEFPEDSELMGLEMLASQALSKAAEAEILLQRGQKLCFDRQYGEGLEALREAASLNDKNPVIRAALLGALVEQARSLLGQDWRAAEPLIKQALSIDEGHPLAKSLQSLVLDYKRQETVNQCVVRARELQASGDLNGALARVDEGLRSFPNEVRLAQLHATLRNLIGPATPAAEPKTVSFVPAPSEKASAKLSTQLEGAGNSLFTLDQSAARTSILPAPPASSRRTSSNSVRQTVATANPVRSLITPMKAMGHRLLLQGVSLVNRGPHLSRLQWIAVAALPIIFLGLFLYPKRPAPKLNLSVPPVPKYAVNFDANVAGAKFRVDGEEVASLPVQLNAGEHHALALLAGYRMEPSEPAKFSVQSPTNVSLHLEPELVRLRVASDLKGGRISIDGKPPLDLQDGGFSDESVSQSAEHKLTLTQAGRECLSLTFRAEPGKIVILSSPVKATDVDALIVSNLGSQAWVYTSNASLKGGFKGQPAQPIPPTGLELNNLTAKSEVVLLDGATSHPMPIEISNAPVLNVVLSSDPTTATLHIESNVPDAEITVGKRKPSVLQGGIKEVRLPPGQYAVHLARDGYLSEDRTVELKKGEVAPPLRIDLKQIVRTASLQIDGGTPGAEVLIDGRAAGVIRPDGGFSKDDIPPGLHAVTLRKSEFEDRAPLSKNFAVGQPVRLSGGDARLTPFASFNFRVTPADAVITLRRDEEAIAQTVVNGTTARVKSGTYTISATLQGYRPRTETMPIAAAGSRDIAWILPETERQTEIPPPPPPPISWEKSPDGWAIHRGNGLGSFGARQGTFDFQVRRPSPKKGTLPFSNKPGRVQWTIDQRSPKNHIDYILEQNSLERKVTIDGKTSSFKNKSIRMGEGDTWALHFEISPGKIVVSSGGKLLDEFTRQNPAEILGVSGFSGDVEVKFLASGGRSQ